MKDIGSLGEELTAKWLECQNYHLLQRNWRCRWGEIDIIAQDKEDKTVIFVEVKTRRQHNWDEGGLLAIDFAKQEKIVKTASSFLAEYPELGDLPCRFDVALIAYITLKVRDAKETEAQDMKRTASTVAIGRAVAVGKYKITMENYLYSAFDA